MDNAPASAYYLTTGDIQSWLTAICGTLVFFMQVGFVVMETGSGRAKNVRNILLKNMVVAMLSALCWWAIGYGLAYGNSAGGVIGTSRFFYEGGGGFPYNDRPWFFSWTFAVGCIAIVSGPLAERTRLGVYPIYTLALALLVHPIAVHWVWSPSSWLNTMSECRVLDFAGGIVVHIVGGLFGLVGALLVGPRLGRFEDGLAKPLPGHDMAFVTLGTFMLWFAWYGFNTGSAFAYMNASGASTRRVAMVTTLSASASGLSALLGSSFLTGTYDLRVCCNGVLCGLVTATPMAGFVLPWVAPVAGTIAGFAYICNSILLLKLRIDDPLDGSAVHCGAGLLGTLLLGLFASPDLVESMTGHRCGGVFFTSTGWLQLGMQFLAVAVVGAFTGLAALLLFGLLRRFNHLRVDQATELAGIDNIDHGGPAYPEFVSRNGGGHNSSVRGGIMH